MAKMEIVSKDDQIITQELDAASFARVSKLELEESYKLNKLFNNSVMEGCKTMF